MAANYWPARSSAPNCGTDIIAIMSNAALPSPRLLCPHCAYEQRTTARYPRCRRCRNLIPTRYSMHKSVEIETDRIRYFIVAGLTYRTVDEVWGEEQEKHPYGE